jgi:hypothetical protein
MSPEFHGWGGKELRGKIKSNIARPSVPDKKIPAEFLEAVIKTLGK